MGERGIGDTNTFVRSVIDAVKSLKPGLSVDEVQSLARVGPKIADNDIDFAGSPTDGGVQRTRPDLSVGCELKGRLSKGFGKIKHRCLRKGSEPTPPILKYRLCSLEKPEDEIAKSPVLASEVAPVAR